MSYSNDYNYNSTFTENIYLVKNVLKNSNIIYSMQYIADEEIQYGKDGSESSWVTEFLSIEKTEDDYNFHIFRSKFMTSYSLPYFGLIDNNRYCVSKLSDLINKFDSIADKSTREMRQFINLWEEFYYSAIKSKDNILIKQMEEFSPKINKLIEIEIEKSTVEVEKIYKAKQIYYKEIINLKDDTKNEDEKNEDIRLNNLIKLYGVDQGIKFVRL
jgi:hypothetical protein